MGSFVHYSFYTVCTCACVCVRVHKMAAYLLGWFLSALLLGKEKEERDGRMDGWRQVGRLVLHGRL